MMFDYFYEAQSESYAFYRTPKVLCTDPRFKDLSADAKLLYGILLDRMDLSKKNHWIDDTGRVYVFMTIKSVEEALGRCHQKAIRIMEELENIGLIERKRQGLCKPSKIYVKNFSAVWDAHAMKYINHTPAGMPIIPPEECESYSNNTDINNTDFINTNLILSRDEMDRIEYRNYLEDRLDMAALRNDHPYDREFLDAIMEIILDIACSKSKFITIAGDKKPTNVVKSQLFKLNQIHIEYVLSCLKRNSTKVRNIKQYIISTLYNAPMTMDCYYQAMVNHDMAGGD
ncbi:MAG: replication initiator protein A [Lachnospiraceae bacterium]|nr:replication initiator protein A [Lachnospiraceae bacterium]